MERSSRAAVLLMLLTLSLPGLAATLTVTTTADNNLSGSLRQAIAGASDGDIIQFQLQTLPATITLSNGDLPISHSIAIIGPGASSLTISGQGNLTQDRIFTIKSSTTVSISGLTVTQGGGGGTSLGSSADNGGAIYNSGNLSFSDCVISNNSVKSTGLGGGAIFNAGGATLSLTRCIVSGNTAGGEVLPTSGTIVGGAIRNANGTVNLTDTTISNNYSQVGGGISSVGTVNIQTSTFSGNEAGIGISTTLTLEGGAIFTSGTSTTTIVNSTFYNNSAKDDGGAITSKGTMSVSFSTFSGNSATSGAGIAVTSHSLTIKGNIFSNDGANCLISGATLLSDGYNLATDASCALTSTGDLPNTAAGLDASGPQNNGGPTPTIALLSNSAAIDAGPAGSCTDAAGNAVSTDQRAVTRPQGTNCDIGAFEFQQSSGTTVTSTADAGPGTLRQAIANANATDTINFSLSYPAIITLTSGVLAVSKNLTFSGPGASNLAISGNGSLQIFSIASGSTVSISGLTLENGSNDNGGAISNSGTLSVSSCVITGNSGAQGAGLNNQVGGVLALTNSTVSGNTATGIGGGLYVAGSSTANVSSSTFVNNTAAEAGGAWNGGALTVVNSTFVGNQGNTAVGAMENTGTLHLSNSTLFNNSSISIGGIFENQGTVTSKASLIAKGSLGSNCAVNGGTIASQGYNLSDDVSCATEFADSSDLNNTAAHLDPSGLQSNGGPTQTVAFLANSPALDAIPAASCTDVDANTLTLDQRGTARPQGTGCDIGAVELVLPKPAITSFTPASGQVGTAVTISGAGFTAAATVAFNGTSATATIDSDTQISATVPSGATTGTITVTTEAGIATSASSFTVVVQPTISGFTPSSGGVGTSVKISGTGFTGASSVAFNGASAAFTVDSDIQVTASVPSGASTGTVSITTPGGTANSSTNFTFIPAPAITSFTPSSGGVGAAVTIAGTGFTGASLVTFNGTSAGFSVNSDTQITATVPSGATSGSIAVTTSGGTATSASTFTVVANLPPSITGFSPGSGGVGTSVTITGSNLKSATLVSFNGSVASFKLSGTKLIATVPAGATTGPISVTTPGGIATTSGNFTLLSAPTITGFTPHSGPIGTAVTLTGTNFTGATRLMFAGKSAPFVVNSATQITATVPKGAKTGDISVSTPGGTATSAVPFTVN
jgi:predicted outer membrane repeat protein